MIPSVEESITFNLQNYHQLCEYLADQDKDLRTILDINGYPPMWTRENTFETLVHIILEQQVSLASALAALNKLKEKTQRIMPETVLLLTDEQMKACFVSRQKIGYIRGLAQEVKDKKILLEQFAKMSNNQVRQSLIGLKGIGNWTIDVYLMFALKRADIFPMGDLAASNALKSLKQLASSASKEEILKISEKWKPFRSIACMMLWHYYLSNIR
ncbi:hypothetical protein [Xanthocytophaga agilis]|uniref:DNA-3-methyladenine glycosylase II n=1 Tax=Xanthocytophaga agilis TaxID=3048010 RepID=A0AAE3RD04_9BACT|nr:hypothetical protein [Xanthocytophaga agilis]MDJ1506307.1 hypothetical protein [Xanthocytophaga agilis]